jgi:hypothetical protein
MPPLDNRILGIKTNHITDIESLDAEAPMFIHGPCPNMRACTHSLAPQTHPLRHYSSPQHATFIHASTSHRALFIHKTRGWLLAA